MSEAQKTQIKIGLNNFRILQTSRKFLSSRNFFFVLMMKLIQSFHEEKANLLAVLRHAREKEANSVSI